MKLDKLNVPKDLQFTDMDDALAAAHGIVSNIPFWHDALISSAQMLRERMLQLENNARITEAGAQGLGWLNYLFVMYENEPEQLLTHALAWLFFTGNERGIKHPCRTVAEGIIKFSGLNFSFEK